MPTTYRVAIASSDTASRAILREQLTQLGHLVVAEATTENELAEQWEKSAADLVVVDMDDYVTIPRIVIKHACEVHRVPIVIVSAKHNEQLIAQAISLCVFGYLIKPIRPADLAVTIAFAMQLFQEFQLRENDLLEMRQALEDRKVIERAKGILMRKQRFDEASAHQHLQSLARNHRQKLIDIARSIVLAEEAIDSPTDPNNETS